MASELAMAVEGEWWFDAERLHLPGDVERMRRAAAVLLDETSRLGVPTQHAAKLEAQLLERTPHDVSREMELVLYGGRHGYSTKLHRMRWRSARSSGASRRAGSRARCTRRA